MCNKNGNRQNFQRLLRLIYRLQLTVSICTPNLCVSLQVACTCLLLTALSCVEADGEVGQAPNDCYTTMPTDLPVTVSYSKSATPTNVSFNFLVRPCICHTSAVDAITS